MTKKHKKTILRIVTFGGTIISLMFVPWPIVWAWILPLPSTVQEQLSEAIDHGFDGILVYVDKGGEEPAHYAAGWHNRENKIPADPHAYFKIGSIRKLYVALATTKLVKGGQLSLDNTLAEYFPELKGRIEYADIITLRMMVQHRSGIPNFTDNPEFWTNPPQNDDEVLAYALDQPAYFEPNSKYGYSNTNYFLISKLIDRVAGHSHQQYIKEEILIPNGLIHTHGSFRDVNLDQLMSGYYVGIEEDIKTTDYGTMIATAEDVGKFLRALNDGSIFEEGEQEIYSSIYTFEHTGLIPGYQSIAKYHQDIDTVVIQFVNTTNFEGYTFNVSQVVYNRIVKIIRKENRL